MSPAIKASRAEAGGHGAPPPSRRESYPRQRTAQLHGQAVKFVDLATVAMSAELRSR
jgi:hypothetical protein